MTDLDPSDQKDILLRYLQRGRDSMLSKLDGASEYDIRRPMTPTGTNLLGLVKHLANVEFEYFGECFGRPSGEAVPFVEEDPNADMVAEASQSRKYIVDRYRRAWAWADETISSLPLDAKGHVPWWKRDVTLQWILVHMATETHRHAGHADIVREMVDGTAGLNKPGGSMPSSDPGWWQAYRDRVERAAREASGS
jgi:Protein of unknown function (DUF664)